MNTNKLLWPTRLGLFATAYLPLFVIFLLVQVDVANKAMDEQNTKAAAAQNVTARIEASEVAEVGWTNRTAMKYLGFPVALVVIGLIGSTILWHSFRVMDGQVRTEGTRMVVQNIEDKGSEALAYASTYIIPFLFEDFDGWPRALALIILLLVIGTVYLNSTMLAINPLLRWFGVGLYQADLRAVTKAEVPMAETRKTLLLIREPMVREGGEIVSESIGPKLAFAIPAPQQAA